MADEFLRSLQHRFDSLTEDQIVYLFVPEILHLKDLYEKKGDVEKFKACEEILRFIKTRVELDNFKVVDWPEKTKLIVPTPSEIINAETKKGLPNN